MNLYYFSLFLSFILFFVCCEYSQRTGYKQEEKEKEEWFQRRSPWLFIYTRQLPPFVCVCVRVETDQQQQPQYTDRPTDR